VTVLVQSGVCTKTEKKSHRRMRVLNIPRKTATRFSMARASIEATVTALRSCMYVPVINGYFLQAQASIIGEQVCVYSLVSGVVCLCTFG
jgi:hypothetical protein